MENTSTALRESTAIVAQNREISTNPIEYLALPSTKPTSQKYNVAILRARDSKLRNILTENMPKNVALMSTEARAIWELTNVFNHIYRTIQKIMRLWIADCWQPIIDACFWSMISTSNGDPRVSNVTHRSIVEIGAAYDAITLRFSEPRYVFVTCEQWYKYTAMTNALSRIQASVKDYEFRRSRMPKPDDYLQLELTGLFPSIDRDRYFVNLLECFDHDEIENATSKFPWPT